MLWKLLQEVVVEEKILKKKPNKKNKQTIIVCVCVYHGGSFRKDKEKLKSLSEPMLQGENPNNVE